MKPYLMILLFPLYSLAQYPSNEVLHYKARVITDSGTISGYYISNSDSVITLSTAKRYMAGNTITIPVNRIMKMNIKNKPGTIIGAASASFILGFIVTAGLAKNAGDVNNDGKTSFWELLFTAIEGTTSGNRRRRNTALVAGAAGGTTAMLIGILSNKKISLNFPINDRQQFFKEKKHKLIDYTKF